MGFVAEEWPICCLGQARVRVEGLRCRAERSTSAEVTATWAKGEMLDVWAKMGEWWLVQDAAGVTGWSWSESLEMG